jgi:hypothetical protein
MATVKKMMKKAQSGVKAKAKTEPMKKGSFADIMGTTLNETTPGKPGYKPITPAEQRLMDKQGAEIRRKRKAGLAFKSGGMLKRADGSYSKRGLWDNIRANKGSGKKPTAQMLKQEKKIKAKSKK